MIGYERVSLSDKPWMVRRIRVFLWCDSLRFTFTSIRCQIHKDPFDALYNLVVGVNIMSASFAHDLLENMPLTPTTKFLKSPSVHILPSLGILCLAYSGQQYSGALKFLYLWHHRVWHVDMPTNWNAYSRRTDKETNFDFWQEFFTPIIYCPFPKYEKWTLS